MKVLLLDLNGKTYSTGKITAYLSGQALDIQEESIELANTGKKIRDNVDAPNLDDVKEVLRLMKELRVKKANLICEVYQSKFTIDELQKSLSDVEIDEQIQKIVNGITGAISKN